MADHDLFTITNPAGALTDPTVLIPLTRCSTSWWSAVSSSDGTTGRAYKGDGTTELAVDWIAFDDTAETGWAAILWDGTLAATGTQQIWLEPPGTSTTVAATATYGAYNAYDDNWLGYWPLEEDPSGTAPQMKNRVADASHLTSEGTMTSGDSVTGKVGQGVEFDGTDDALSATVSQTGQADWTLVAWVQAPASGHARAMNIGDTATDANYRSLDLETGVDFGFWNRWNTSDSVLYTSSTPVSGTWYHMAGTNDSSTTAGAQVLYVDGAQVATGSYNDADNSSLVYDIVGIGALKRLSDVCGGGAADGPQIHTTVRSADWIAFDYAMRNDPATFWGTGTWSGGSSIMPIIMQQM